MKIKVIDFIVVFALVLFSLVPGCTFFGNDKEEEELYLRIDTDKDVYSPGEGVEITFVVVNNKPERIQLMLATSMPAGLVCSFEEENELNFYFVGGECDAIVDRYVEANSKETIARYTWSQENKEGLQAPAGEYRIRMELHHPSLKAETTVRISEFNYIRTEADRDTYDIGETISITSTLVNVKGEDIRFTLDTAGGCVSPVIAYVYDSANELVWDSAPREVLCVYTEEQFTYPAKSETSLDTFTWDLLDNHGAAVPTGSYSLKVSIGHGVVDGERMVRIINSSFRELWNDTFLCDYDHIYPGDHEGDSQYMIHLESRTFIPRPGMSDETRDNILGTPLESVHVFMQFTGNPSEEEWGELEGLGVTVTAYLHDYAWHALVPSSPDTLENITNLSFVRWIGDIYPVDKTSSGIRDRTEWTDDPDREIRLLVILFEDVSANETKAVIDKYNDTIQEYSSYSNYLSLTTTCITMLDMICEDVVQWAEEDHHYEYYYR